MLPLVIAHLLAAVASSWLVRRLGSRAFHVLAAVPAAGLAYLAMLHGTAADAPTQGGTWVESLGMALSFRLDDLAYVMSWVVLGVGTLVLIYCGHYFDADKERGLGLFAGCLVAFAGVMVGLVTADDLLLLYVFWELTTVLSYLLIAYKSDSRASVGAAKQALIVTTAGGLAMLVGIVLVGEAHGTYRISGILADPQTSGAVTTGVLLLLVGAFTKSAQIPFHFWLPGAMAAPTPVSAYLHAASMVKAGIYLVARLAPGFAGIQQWQWGIVLLGGGTMLVGGYRALRQYDLKLVLAYGTVSQLGFMTLLVGAGHQAALLGGLGVVVAHALFKSALFLSVGAIDHAYGTRDIRRLHSVRSDYPWLAAAIVAGSLSMAGLPPLFGFDAKETAIHSYSHPDTWWGWVGLVIVVLGSALTVAYTARFLWGSLGHGAFGSEAGDPAPRRNAPDHHEAKPLLWLIPVLLGLTGLVLGLFPHPVDALLQPVAGQVPAIGKPQHLALWHGFNLALGLSVLTWLAGAALFHWRGAVAAVQRRHDSPLDAGQAYQQLTHLLDRVSLKVTGELNVGSTPVLLATIFAVLVAAPLVPLWHAVSAPQVRWADSTAQVAVGLVIAVCAIAAARATRRIAAVLLVGITGYGMVVLFTLHGAPDLALTQVLVETVSLVVFVLVLRRLPVKFHPEGPRWTRRARLALSAAVAIVVPAGVLVAAGSRQHGQAAGDLQQRAYDYGGGRNVVNVILVDVRAWDTMGELSVVLAAAAGVASLVFVRQQAMRSSHHRAVEARPDRADLSSESDTGSIRWLPAGIGQPGARRSLLFEVVTRLFFHTLMVWSIYLLLAGHNAPGGGFAAGLVAGLALTMRYLAGGGYELRVAAPIPPSAVLGTGLALAGLSALLPMFFGSPTLRTWVFDVPLGPLGGLHIVTSVLFDVGVYLVVTGLMLDVLRSLGSSLDSQITSEGKVRT